MDKESSCSSVRTIVYSYSSYFYKDIVNIWLKERATVSYPHGYSRFRRRGYEILYD